MKATIYHVGEESTLGIGWEGDAGWGYGYQVELPPHELVDYIKARDEWMRVQARLKAMFKAKQKRSDRRSKRFWLKPKYKKLLKEAAS